MKKLILIAGLIAGATTAATAQTKAQTTQTTEQTIETVNVKTFKEKMQTQKKAILLDVRTPQEYEQGHIDNAKNIDVLQPDFKDKIARLDKNTPVFVYCRSGHRSMKAAEILKQNGFKKIYNLAGGYMAWSQQK